MKISLPSLFIALVVWPASALAHDGVDHGADATAADNAARPYWISATRLHVAESLQQRLALRSSVATDEATNLRLSAEVRQHPASTSTVSANGYGRIESAGNWPLAGQRVQKDEVLAWLRPLFSVQQDSERRRDLQLLEQQLQIAQINLSRLRSQVEASAGATAANNVYYDEAALDDAALKQRIELARRALDERIALRAPADGILVGSAVGDGDVVDTGNRLFTIAATGRLRIALPVFDAAQVRQPPALTLHLDDRNVVLAHTGNEPAASGQGWQLLYDGADAATGALTPGEIVEVSTRTETATRPCLRNSSGAELWVQVEAEVFERRRAADCEQIQITATERWVRDGAAILAQYR